MWSVNASLPVASVRTLDQIRAASMAETSFALVMLGIAAVVALLLGVVGIYGVIAYIAVQRTREIGIRMALGATTRSVVVAFVSGGLRLGAIGAALGIVVALAASRVLSTLLFGVSATDAVSFARAIAIVFAGVVLATLVPAWRAARTNPLTALRHH